MSAARLSIAVGDGRSTEELVAAAACGCAHSCVVSEEAIEAATACGLSRPTYEDALYFGVAHPDVQRERPVVFLHDPWFGHFGRRDVVCPWTNAGRRELGLEDFDGRWSANHRVAFIGRGRAAGDALAWGPMAPAANLESALRERFRFAGFRPGQRELIEAVLAGRDALGILPTGGGKSLTYQLPATLLEGLTVVVSPLIALMKDQVDAFNQRGVGRAVAIHSHLPPGSARAAFERARSGAARLLYLAPERLEIAEWRRRLQDAAPRLLVVDEAHCVSQWGYDFRPAYLALRDVAEQVRPCAVLALTATATPAVRDDVVRQLGLRDPLVLVAPFDRPNLRLEVRPCEPEDKAARLTEILRAAPPGGSHIVYVGRRRDAETVAAELDGKGLGAVAYHAGLTADRRQHAQEAWLSGRRPIVVATVAFGMGIDKPDVRTVVHWQHPSSLEAYYQEAGRAGRDGAAARCVILFSEQDADLQDYFLQQRYPTVDDVRTLLREIPSAGVGPEQVPTLGVWLTAEQRHVALHALVEEGAIARAPDGGIRRPLGGSRRRLALTAMRARRAADEARVAAIVAYCRDRRCHRRRLLAYFGEPLPEDYRCGNCSACGRPRPGARPAPVRGVAAAPPRDPKSGPPLRQAPPVRAVHGTTPALVPEAEPEPASAGDVRPAAAATVAPAAGITVGPAPVADVGPDAGGGPMHDEMVARRVPRRVGLAILELVAVADGLLAASGIANVLRGVPASDAVRRHPHLVGLPLFGTLKERGYEELLADVQAMHAKGFLAPAARTRRLALSDAGRRAVATGSGRAP